MPETLGPTKHVEPEAFRNSLNESQGRGRQRDMDGLRQGGRERMQKKKKRGCLCYSEILALGQQQVLYKNMRLLDIQLITAPMESHWDTRHS